MGFWIYEKRGESYTRVCSVKLTGEDGLIAKYLKQNSEVDTPFSWKLGMDEIVGLVDPGLDPKEHVLVIDMLPEELLAVSLYRVSAIQGCSEFDDTDLVLACKILYQGRNNVLASEFKEAFLADGSQGDRQLLEALRLTGGTQEGSYIWTKPKMDIGAAVCSESRKLVQASS